MLCHQQLQREIYLIYLTNLFAEAIADRAALFYVSMSSICVRHLYFSFSHCRYLHLVILTNLVTIAQIYLACASCTVCLVGCSNAAEMLYLQHVKYRAQEHHHHDHLTVPCTGAHISNNVCISCRFVDI